MSTKKEEQEPVYDVVSIIEGKHLCTFVADDKGTTGYAVAKYKALIMDEEGERMIVSCLNEEDLCDSASEGFFGADKSFNPYKYDMVGVNTFMDMVKYEMTELDGHLLDAIEEVIYMINECGMAITEELDSYLKSFKINNVVHGIPRHYGKFWKEYEEFDKKLKE